MTDDILLARTYFQDAVGLAPTDARLLGFQASLEMAEGQIRKDEHLTRTGYFRMQRAIDAWPQFNLFTAGYTLEGSPVDSPRFAEAVEDQWRDMEACIASGHLDRAHPDFTPFLAQETRTGPFRACWNSEIAPHNFEGFFLNFGDLLVKQGRPELGRTVYRNAQRSATYAEWPYRSVLERRLEAIATPAGAEASTAHFRELTPDPARTIMAQSPFACMACHQR